MPEITLRFVTSDTMISRFIRVEAGVSMPFTPSHVEAVSRDGKSYTGMHINGGCLARPIGYDADEPNLKEKFVPLPVNQEQFETFHAYIESKIGEPYDWKAIIGFLDDWQHLHEFEHMICSAFMLLALRAPIPSPAEGEASVFFRWPLTKPAHRVSPDLLLAILSTHVQIDH